MAYNIVKVKVKKIKRMYFNLFLYSIVYSHRYIVIYEASVICAEFKTLCKNHELGMRFIKKNE